MKKLFYVLTATALLMVVMVSCKDTKVTDVQLNKTVLTLYVGGTETLIATVLPKDADNKAVSWTSSNTDVATIDHDGKITAIAEGTATITVTTEDGDKTTSCSLTVTKFIEEPEMVFVEGGTFMYGSSDAEDSLGHYPKRQVTVKSFYISKYLITQKLWKDVMGKLPSLTVEYGSGIGDDYPAYYASFPEIRQFVNELNRITGKNYWYISSEEWEYAARGGNKSKGYTYSGSNNIDEVAWYSENSDNSVHPVGKKLPNELGIYDMSGNVWEWTLTEFDPNKPLKQPTYLEIRGGSYTENEYLCRLSSWKVQEQKNSFSNVGFRIILLVPNP